MSRETNNHHEINSAPITPRLSSTTPTVSCPPSQYHSPSLSRSPLLDGAAHGDGHPPPNQQQQQSSQSKTPKTPRTPRTPRLSITPRQLLTPFITPLGSPVRKALRLTKLDPQDAWLPITESRNGNQYYAAFHTLCSGIGIQALVLPLAFTILGCLTFGERLTNIFALFPILYLSGGTCTTLIIIGGSTGKSFFQIVCGPDCAKELTTVEWYLVFTCVAIVLSQLPNMNSIAGVSLIGAITAVGYCTLIWGVSVSKGKLPNVSYDPVKEGASVMEQIFSVFNALGIIAFAFRGHNLILEIQATMPSSEKHPSHVPMWKGVRISYTLIAACLYPLAIGGYWAYGHLIPANGGMLTALFQFHSRDVSRFILGLTSFFVIVNALCSFNIYGMPTFDDMESKYTSKKKKAMPWWLRALSRAFFGFFCFFIAVALPFLGSVAGLIGGLALPVTLAYPCFMWLKIKKPKKLSPIWCLNWSLGVLGMCLSVLVIAAGLYVVIETGVKVSFFNPS
ncbi:hypothetical protein F8388_007714 [Cannabis sativa]|uniref:Amino acid transporter transmembrane domain-containing protein n=1 Tax=Cannabis sativa TaxID=3483 RepID=A0A7J6FT42_CANSA|nr:hypothetical protein F8388_007714 [Cannabis sativa]